MLSLLCVNLCILIAQVRFVVCDTYIPLPFLAVCVACLPTTLSVYPSAPFISIPFLQSVLLPLILLQPIHPWHGDVGSGRLGRPPIQPSLLLPFSPYPLLPFSFSFSYPFFPLLSIPSSLLLLILLLLSILHGSIGRVGRLLCFRRILYGFSSPYPLLSNPSPYPYPLLSKIR